MTGRELPLIKDRACGPCTLCCKTHRIEEIGKPSDEWCPHVRRGVGCGIYSTRPGSCRGFECLWRAGVPLFGEADRPDKTGLVFDVPLGGRTHVSGPTGRSYPMLTARERHPGAAAETRAQPLIRRLTSSGFAVVIGVRGQARAIYYPGGSCVQLPDLVEVPTEPPPP